MIIKLNFKSNIKKSNIITYILCFIVCSFSFSQNNWDKADEIINQLNPVNSFLNTSYLITDFGAKGDGKTPCKLAFDNAITTCSDNGGGTIIVTKGDYFMNGPLVLKSNVHIELKAGAILNFSTNENDYLPAVITRWEGTELYNFSPLIYAYQVKNIAITGKGTINGNGSKNFASWKNLQAADKKTLRKMGKENVPVYKRVFGEGHKLRPGFFEPFGCTNVRIEGITILDSPFWVLHPIYCNNVIIRDVTVISNNPNNDGCDPESSTNVLIEDCNFITGDDAIAIKSGRDNDAWRVGQPSENIVIRNCVFSSKINGVCIGSEISGGVRNVFIENIKIPKSSNAIYFKSNLDRGGYIENIYVRNITAGSVASSLIRFEPNYKGEHSAFHPTKFKNFMIENITCKESNQTGFYLAGFEELPIENILLKDIFIEKSVSDYSLKKGKNIVFDNVSINGKS
ncbi:glycoside hydrolase family 28 protein [Polaribacter glomeratus]|nr:glycoside hydrolase family 28 protein [Polaribacter glomeratus]